jgi:DNA-binding transcriptional ArsR family regulator
MSPEVFGSDATAERLKQVQRIIQAADHPIRKKILLALSEIGHCPVTRLHYKIKEPQAIVSQQLSILRTAGWVDFVKKGRNVTYFIKPECLELYIKLLRLINSEENH